MRLKASPNPVGANLFRPATQSVNLIDDFVGMNVSSTKAIQSLRNFTSDSSTSLYNRYKIIAINILRAIVREFRRKLILFFVLMLASSLIHGEELNKDIPHFDAVMEILAPLEYSGMHNIVAKDSQLSVDFNTRTWTLHNIFQYDQEGSDILVEGKGGLCVRLTRYVYKKIKPIFPADRYEILFEKVKERDYFFSPQATHFLLTILDKESSLKYLIDPSFKRYGRVDDFEEYEFFDRLDPEAFIKVNRSSDKSFGIDSASPLFIRDGYLLVFSVESVDGKVDRNHFILSISAVKRQAQSGEYVLGLKYEDGYIQTYSNDKLMRLILKPDEVTKFKQRLLQWSMVVSGNSSS